MNIHDILISFTDVAFLYDEEIDQQPFTPRELIKWEEPSDVTDRGIDFDQVYMNNMINICK